MGCRYRPALFDSDAVVVTRQCREKPQQAGFGLVRRPFGLRAPHPRCIHGLPSCRELRLDSAIFSFRMLALDDVGPYCLIDARKLCSEISGPLDLHAGKYSF
jgi:hypothetical protein